MVLRIPKIPLLDDINPRNAKVLLRIDINSPIDHRTGKIIDNIRLKAHVDTIRELVIERNCAVTLIAHQGRPGDKDFCDLSQHAELLSKYVGLEIKFIDDVIGPAAREAINKLKPGEVLLLDNVRFVSEELIEALPEKQAETYLVRRLAPLFNYYVNDAFGTAHRSQPSIVGFPLKLPSAAGRLMELEVKALSKAFSESSQPRIFVLGGGKVYDTLRIIENIVKNKVADRILTTGLVAQLFLVAKAVNIGEVNKEFLEEKGLLGLVPRARRLLLLGAPIETPIDFKTVDKNGNIRNETVGNIKGLIMDIGDNTITMYSDLIKEANVVVMRGPAGVMEDPRFREGTEKLVKAALMSKAFTILGGGHLTAIISWEEAKRRGNTHLSTGGGALLLFLAGEPLPALEALHLSAKKFLKIN
ncbi:MAG: phosphoglycerate kinase [Thermoprotei archaeon]|nr:MAG: phosphoglycerate kinase [Thermoprotei archaeon]